MSKEKNTFLFECRSSGNLYWNKNSGENMLPIFCPFSGETCRVACPFIQASEEGLIFKCGPHFVAYRGDWKNDTEDNNG